MGKMQLSARRHAWLACVVTGCPEALFLRRLAGERESKRITPRTRRKLFMRHSDDKRRTKTLCAREISRVRARVFVTLEAGYTRLT